MNDPNSSLLQPQTLSDDLEISIRHGFIRKVLGIVSAQLALTFAIALPFLLHAKQVDEWVGHHAPLVVVIALLPIVLLCSGMCFPALMRTSPFSYIFLTLFTVCEALIVGYVSIQYTTESVMMVIAITSVVSLALTLFALQTKYDFTSWLPYMMVIMLVFCLFSIMFFFIHTTFMEKLYGGIGAMIFSVYLVIDIQMIVGGKHHSHQFGLDDYVFAALNIYLDIIQLFLYLLQLFGDRRAD